MLTRRRLIGLSIAIGSAASAVKAFATRLPRLGIAAQVAKPADALKGKICNKGDSRYEIYRRGASQAFCRGDASPTVHGKSLALNSRCTL